MKMRLVCGQDARELGIEQDDGSWRLDKFEEHIKKCAECKRFTQCCLGVLGFAFDEFFGGEEEEE